jgi:hypothetical protein
VCACASVRACASLRAYARLCADVDDTIVVYAGGWADGRLPNATASSSVWSSTDGATWECVTTAAPWDPREAAAGVVFKGEMWIMGGTRQYYYSNNSHDLRNDVWHSKDGKEWVQATPSAQWSPRAYHNAVVLGDSIYVFGGGNYQTSGEYGKAHKGGFVVNDVWKSTDGVHWTQCVEHAPWAGRIWQGAVVFRGEMWVMGGTVDTRTPPVPGAEPVWANTNDVWHSADGIHWVQDTSPGIWTPRHAFGVYAWRDAIWMAAGNDWNNRTDGILNELWKLQPNE